MFDFKEGFYSDVRIEDRFTTSIRYRNGALEESKQSSVKKAFIRVYDGKMWYYASTETLLNVQKELDGLYELAEYCADIEENPVVKRFEINRAKTFLFKDCSTESVARDEKQKLLKELFPLVKKYPEIKLATLLYTDRHSDFTFQSSKGADLAYDYQTCGVATSFYAAEGEKNFSFNYQQGRTKFSDLKGISEGVLASIEEGLNFLKEAADVEPGDYPVILTPEAAGVFAHESFGHKSEADFMLGDETMKKEWALGTIVGADILSIYDSGIDFGSGYTPYDDEGTKATKTYLIKNGVLSGRLHSVSTAADLDESPTGNARAISCDYEPIVRMTNTVIDAGDKTKEELFAGIQHGYYIKTLKHGSGMSTFTIAPSLAYEIVDGKVGDPVKIAVITGNVFETLDLIDGLSDHTEMFSFVTGGCGKMEQYPLPVGFGGPYVSIAKMNVQ